VEGMFQVEKWLHKVIKLLTGVIGTPFWICNENGFKNMVWNVTLYILKFTRTLWISIKWINVSKNQLQTPKR
jgi:hypothetical protein